MLNRFHAILFAAFVALAFAGAPPAQAENLFRDNLPVICMSGCGSGMTDGADVTQGSKADAGDCTVNHTLLACIRQMDADIKGAIPQACTGNIPVSQITSTDLKTGTGKIYICSIKITSGDAENLSLVEGTGTICATNTVALDGATTAANGNQIAANGGWAEVSPGYMFGTSVTGNHLCLLQSGTGRVAGHITYSDH